MVKLPSATEGSDMAEEGICVNTKCKIRGPCKTASCSYGTVKHGTYPFNGRDGADGYCCDDPASKAFCDVELCKWPVLRIHVPLR